PNQVSGIQTFQDAQYVVQYMPSGNGGGGGGGGGQGLFAGDERLDTVDVGAGTNSVSATDAFANALRAWNFHLENPTTTDVTGAQVAVDSTSTGLNLNSSGFSFSW